MKPFSSVERIFYFTKKLPGSISVEPKRIILAFAFYNIHIFSAEPDEKATVFWGLAADLSGSILKQQAQKLKTMRHPNILTYLDSAEVCFDFLDLICSVLCNCAECSVFLVCCFYASRKTEALIMPQPTVNQNQR